MQKKLKTLGLVLLAFTLTTAVGVSVNTETASAKKVNAKTLKLKKKLSIKVGDKKTLKATVKPKNATLKWKSSNKKIATVTQKGVVKGKKKGTAKITVTSGKKKATCKVTVKQTYSIKTVQVINSKVIRVTLNKAKKLTTANFAVKKSSSSDAKNFKALSVSSVLNSKNKVYDLVLSTDYDADSDMNYIADEDYVQITVKKLNGVKTLGASYYAATVPANEYVGGVTGKVVNENVYFNSSYKGYLSNVKVTGLPAGLSYTRRSEHSVTIKGIPTAVANGTVATMTAKDEQGKTLSQKIYFYIGSNAEIVSYVPFEYRTILANNNSGESYTVYAYGGSGDYTLSLNNNANKYISANSGSGYSHSAGSVYFDGYLVNDANVKQYLPAGNYNVAYTVTDSENANIKANGTLAVTAVNGIKITGKVTAADNTPVEYAEVEAYFKDVNNAYKYNQFSQDTASTDYTDEYTKAQIQKGTYELTVFPSQAYEITVSKSGAERGVVNYNPGTANSVLNFALPLYKVTFAATGIDMTKTEFSITGVDQSAYLSEESNYAYLKKGMYVVDTTATAVSGTGFNQTSASYKLSGSFTVNGNMNVNLNATKVGSDVPVYSMTALTLDQSKVVSNDDYYTFTPSEDGQYVFQSMDEEPMTVSVYDQTGTSFVPYSIEASHDYTTMEIEFKKDTKYVLRFSATGRVKVSKFIPTLVTPPGEEDDTNAQ